MKTRGIQKSNCRKSKVALKREESFNSHKSKPIMDQKQTTIKVLAHSPQAKKIDPKEIISRLKVKKRG
jgi:hypothetical protein